MQTKKTAPFDVSYITKQVFQIFSSKTKWLMNRNDCSCALARPSQRSIWFGLDLFGSFCIKAKRTENQKADLFIFFLLLVQKKERKKSTPAMIYSHCRTPWFSFSATVNWAKQFLSSASTIIVICFLDWLFPQLVSVLYQHLWCFSAFFFVVYSSKHLSGM